MKSTESRLNQIETRIKRIAIPQDGMVYFALVFGDSPAPDNLAPDGLLMRLPVECATREDVERYAQKLRKYDGHWNADLLHAHRQLMMLSPEWPEYQAEIRAYITGKEIKQYGEPITTWDD